jgi:hypothetical protein
MATTWTVSGRGLSSNFPGRSAHLLQAAKVASLRGQDDTAYLCFVIFIVFAKVMEFMFNPLLDGAKMWYAPSCFILIWKVENHV